MSERERERERSIDRNGRVVLICLAHTNLSEVTRISEELRKRATHFAIFTGFAGRQIKPDASNLNSFPIRDLVTLAMEQCRFGRLIKVTTGTTKTKRTTKNY